MNRNVKQFTCNNLLFAQNSMLAGIFLKDSGHDFVMKRKRLAKKKTGIIKEIKKVDRRIGSIWQ